MAGAYTDGTFTSAVQNGPKRIFYPFLNSPTKDSTTKGTQRNYVVLPTSFSPASALSTDPDDNTQYLVEETELAVEAGVGRFSRTYCKVPSAQTVPVSVAVSKPTIPGDSTYPKVIGSYLAAQPDTTLPRFDAYYRQTVTSDSGAPGFYPTGGTYTLTFGGDTTGSLNYNDTSGTVQTALNALTSVTNRGGLTVSGSYNSAGGFAITFNDYAAATVNAGSLTTSSGVTANAITTSNGGYTQLVQITGGGPGATITAGTFTISIFSQTTAAIAYNASAATVQSALNALSGVSNRGNCTISLASGYTSILSSNSESILFTVSFANSVMTAASGSLTPGGSTATPSITDAVGRTQKIVYASSQAFRDIYCASHGITTSDTIFIKGGSSYYTGIAGGTSFTVPNSNTIRLLILASDSYASASTITEVGKRTKTSYQPGTIAVVGSRITNFYLPTVTPGITTAADIPIPTSAANDIDLLLAIFSGSSTINVNVGMLEQWRGPILSLTYEQVSAANL